MGVTVANLAPGEYFVLADGLPEEEFAPLPVRERLPFCSFCDAEISPPQCRNGRVSFTLHLSSCKVRLVFEGAENFVCDADFVRVKRGKTLQFLDCSIQKCGNAYVYSLTAGAGEAKFTFRSAYAQLRGIVSAAEYITGRLSFWRERLRCARAEGGDEACPDADFFFFPFFDEKQALGSFRKEDMPFYAMWRLHAALSEGEIGGEGEEKGNRRLETGGYLRYFRECGYDLLPLLQKYAPHWAENYAAAGAAYAAGDLAELARRTAEHLTGRWYARGGAAALAYSDLLSLSEYCNTPQGRREKSRERSYGREFVRALYRAAQEM